MNTGYQKSEQALASVGLEKKVFVQQVLTKKYLTKRATWVKHQDNAHCFKDSMEAVGFCVEKGIREVTILLCFGNPNLDVGIHCFVDQSGSDS